jgi:hypothetical protein
MREIAGPGPVNKNRLLLLFLALHDRRKGELQKHTNRVRPPALVLETRPVSCLPFQKRCNGDLETDLNDRYFWRHAGHTLQSMGATGRGCHAREARASHGRGEWDIVHFSKYFLCHSSHRIFRRMHGVLNVGKKIIVQFVCKGRDESFEPN